MLPVTTTEGLEFRARLRLAIAMIKTSFFLLLSFVNAATAATGKLSQMVPKTLSLPRSMTDQTFTLKMHDISILAGAAELVTKKTVGATSEEDPVQKGPVIWIGKGNDQKVLDLREAFTNYTISHVFEDEESNRLFILLDYGVEGPVTAYPVLASSDAGKTWQRLADLKRPPFSFPPADLVSLYMDRAGHGKAIFTIDSSQHATEKTLQSIKKTKGPETLYIASTVNGGKSWQYPKEPWTWNSLSEVNPDNGSSK